MLRVNDQFVLVSARATQNFQELATDWYTHDRIPMLGNTIDHHRHGTLTQNLVTRIDAEKHHQTNRFHLGTVFIALSSTGRWFITGWFSHSSLITGFGNWEDPTRSVSGEEPG